MKIWCHTVCQNQSVFTVPGIRISGVLQPSAADGDLEQQQQLVKPSLEVISFWLEMGGSSQVQVYRQKHPDGYGLVVWASMAAFRAAQKQEGPTAFPFGYQFYANEWRVQDSPLQCVRLPPRKLDEHLTVFRVCCGQGTSVRFFLLAPVPRGWQPVVRSMSMDQLASQMSGCAIAPSAANLSGTEQLIQGKCAHCHLAKGKLLTCSGCHLNVYCSKVRNPQLLQHSVTNSSAEKF